MTAPQSQPLSSDHGGHTTADVPGDGSPDLRDVGFDGSLSELVALARTRRIDLQTLSLPDLMAALERVLVAEVSHSLSRAGDWVVLSSWLLWYWSQGLIPAAEETPAQTDANARRGHVDALQHARALARWLETRPQLGHDVFARGRAEDAMLVKPEGAPQVDVIEFLWAAMGLFGETPDLALLEAQYRPGHLPLFSVEDAAVRMRTVLQGRRDRSVAFRELLPAGEAVDDAPPKRGSSAWLRARSALTSTLSACLEMAKQGEVHLQQDQPWDELVANVTPRISM